MVDAPIGASALLTLVLGFDRIYIMTEIIKWKNKEYKMPFDADYYRQKDDSFKEEIIVNNRFSNEPAMLPWFAVALYDVIMGSEQTQDWDNHRKGLDWFIKYFPKQYSVLLD